VSLASSDVCVANPSWISVTASAAIAAALIASVATAPTLASIRPPTKAAGSNAASVVVTADTFAGVAGAVVLAPSVPRISVLVVVVSTSVTRGITAPVCVTPDSTIPVAAVMFVGVARPFWIAVTAVAFGASTRSAVIARQSIRSAVANRFVAPRKYSVTNPKASTAASGMSSLWTPGILVPSTATNPPDVHAPPTVCVASVIAVGVPAAPLR